MCYKFHFAQFGIPDILISDNGPQFSGDKFKLFSDEYQFEYQTSTSQSNGMAKNSIKCQKSNQEKAVYDRKDPYLSLLEYYNMSIVMSIALGSPAQRLMERRIIPN